MENNEILYIDGISKIESLGATIRVEFFVYENNGKQNEAGEPQIDRKVIKKLVMPTQAFPEFTAMCGKSMDQFLNDGIYKRAAKEEAAAAE